MSVFDNSESWGTINAKNMLNIFGLAISEGADSFDRPADPKPVYSYKWGGSKGTQYDLSSTPVDDSRVFYLKGWLLGTNLADFKARKALLMAEIKKAGYVQIYCKKYNVTVNAKLKAFTNYESPQGYSFQNGNFIGVEITIEFDEVEL